MSESAPGQGVTLDDLRIEVVRARRLGLCTVAIRRRMACPSCSVDGEPYSPGPVLLEVPVEWPAGLPARESVDRALRRCVEAARSAGILAPGTDLSS